MCFTDIYDVCAFDTYNKGYLLTHLLTYLLTYSPSKVAWSEGQRPLGAALHSPDEPSELSQ